MTILFYQVENWRRALQAKGIAPTNAKVWKYTVMSNHAGGYGGKDEALNVSKNKQDKPVGLAKSQGQDFSEQWDPLDAQLQESWQWGIYHKTPESLPLTFTVLPQEVIRNVLHQTNNKPRKWKRVM